MKMKKAPDEEEKTGLKDALDALGEATVFDGGRPRQNTPFPTPVDEVYVGAMVLFKMPEGPGAGNIRPAIVVGFVDDDARDAVALQVVTHKSVDANAIQFYDWVRRGSRLGEWQPLIKYNWNKRTDLPRPQ